MGNKLRDAVSNGSTSFIFALTFCAGCLAQSPIAERSIKTSHYIRGPEKENVIIFIHGLNGDSHETWYNAHFCVHAYPRKNDAFRLSKES